MSDLAIALGYGIAALWVTRRVFRALVEDAGRMLSTDWFDVVCYGTVALIVGAFFWPLVALFMLLRSAVGESDPAAFVRKVGGESRDARLARQADEIRAHERRIAELERDLEIGKSGTDSRLRMLP